MTRNMKTATAAEPGTPSAFWAGDTAQSTLRRHCAQYSTCRVSHQGRNIHNYHYFTFEGSLSNWQPHMGPPVPMPAFAEEALTTTEHTAAWLVGESSFLFSFLSCDTAGAAVGTWHRSWGHSPHTWSLHCEVKSCSMKGLLLSY